jgi:FixJ family two-component response regulator
MRRPATGITPAAPVLGRRDSVAGPEARTAYSEGAIQAGIERNRARRQEAKVVAELQERFDSLTSREREVLTLVITGRPNKQVAAQLELSEMTVKVHRSQIMRKMRANSLVDLVRMADRLGVSTGKS